VERSAGESREERAPTTREALLAAATELFGLHGFDGVSIEDLARRARVNKALISYHFGGKRPLYRAVVGAAFKEAHASLRSILASGRPPAGMLGDFLRGFHELATRRRPYLAALLLREALAAGPAFDRDIAPQIVRIFEGVREIIERGVRAKAFVPVNPFLTHLTIVSSLSFYYATAPARRRLIRTRRLPVSEPSGEEFVAHLERLLLHGLVPKDEAAASRRGSKG
jgi:TetR/AcrR family transcriptional regulator